MLNVILGLSAITLGNLSAFWPLLGIFDWAMRYVGGRYYVMVIVGFVPIKI